MLKCYSCKVVKQYPKMPVQSQQQNSLQMPSKQIEIAKRSVHIPNPKWADLSVDHQKVLREAYGDSPNKFANGSDALKSLQKIINGYINIGPNDGIKGSKTSAGIKAFQGVCGYSKTGHPDPTTCVRIVMEDFAKRYEDQMSGLQVPNIERLELKNYVMSQPSHAKAHTHSHRGHSHDSHSDHMHTQNVSSALLGLGLPAHEANNFRNGSSVNNLNLALRRNGVPIKFYASGGAIGPRSSQIGLEGIHLRTVHYMKSFSTRFEKFATERNLTERVVQYNSLKNHGHKKDGFHPKGRGIDIQSNEAIRYFIAHSDQFVLLDEERTGAKFCVKDLITGDKLYFEPPKIEGGKGHFHVEVNPFRRFS